MFSCQYITTVRYLQSSPQLLFVLSCRQQVFRTKFFRITRQLTVCWWWRWGSCCWGCRSCTVCWWSRMRPSWSSRVPRPSLPSAGGQTRTMRDKEFLEKLLILVWSTYLPWFLVQNLKLKKFKCRNSIEQISIGRCISYGFI